jgi:hypothetical protein
MNPLNPPYQGEIFYSSPDKVSMPLEGRRLGGVCVIIFKK